MQVSKETATSHTEVVRLKVESIVQDGDVLTVTLSAHNGGNSTVTMVASSFYVYDYANSGRRYPVIPDGARWPETIPTGDEKVYGTMRLQGPLDPSTSQLTVGFDDVRGSPEGTTIYVPHVYLLPR